MGDGMSDNRTPDVDDEIELVRRMTRAMREADQAFEQVGGSSRHHVRDHLLPVLEKHGLKLVLLPKEVSDG